jgi:hypothetical protein
LAASTSASSSQLRRYVPAADLEQPAQDSGVERPHLSYEGTVPSVHRRTIHESAGSSRA